MSADSIGAIGAAGVNAVGSLAVMGLVAKTGQNMTNSLGRNRSGYSRSRVIRRSSYRRHGSKRSSHGTRSARRSPSILGL